MRLYVGSTRNGTLYVGVTSNLIKRVYEHRSDVVEGFTNRYNVHSLVCCEVHLDMLQAIAREKQLKKWSRSAKIGLIEKDNASWRDLWQELVSPSMATGFRQSMPE